MEIIVCNTLPVLYRYFTERRKPRELMSYLSWAEGEEGLFSVLDKVKGKQGFRDYGMLSAEDARHRFARGAVRRTYSIPHLGDLKRDIDWSADICKQRERMPHPRCRFHGWRSRSTEGCRKQLLG